MASRSPVSLEDVIESAVERAVDRSLSRITAALDRLEHKTPSQLLTVKQAADAMGVHPSTVRRMVAAGELTSLRVGKNGVRIDSASIHGTAH